MLLRQTFEQRLSNNHSSTKRVTAMHVYKPRQEANGRGRYPRVTSNCIEICGNQSFNGKSCAKIVLVEMFTDQSTQRLRTYALIDNQSNSTLIKPELPDALNIDYEMI